MKAFVCLLALLTVPSLAAAEKSYNAGSRVVHDCDKDAEASINTSSAKVTITGKCKKISLNGSGLEVTIASVEKLLVNGSSIKAAVEAVDKLSVNGSGNQVTYKRAVNRKSPKVSAPGFGNKISRVK